MLTGKGGSVILTDIRNISKESRRCKTPFLDFEMMNTPITNISKESRRQNITTPNYFRVTHRGISLKRVEGRGDGHGAWHTVHKTNRISLKRVEGNRVGSLRWLPTHVNTEYL